MTRELDGNAYKQSASHSEKYVEFLFKVHNHPKTGVGLWVKYYNSI